MKNKPTASVFWVRLLSFFSLLFFVFVIFTALHCKRKGEKKPSYETDQVYPVSLVQVTTENIPENLEVKGVFSPSEKLEVKSEVNAKVLLVKVKEGDLINQNDSLAVLESEKLKLILDKLRFELKEVEARKEAGLPPINSENSSLQEPNSPKPVEPASPNKADFASPSLKSPRQNSPEEAKENSPSETAPIDKKDQSQEGLTARAEEASIDRLKAEIALTEKQLEAVHVTSGISGILTKKEIAEGSFVKRGDSLFHIVRLDPIYFVISLPKPAILNLQKGSRLEVYSDDLPGQTLVGEVVLIAPEENSQTKSYEVKLSIPNIMLKLRGGMIGKLIVPAFQIKKVASIPESAIIDRNQKKYVYVVDQYQAEIREVELGRKIGDKIEVTKGLKEGESIVSKGQFSFRQDKEKVKVE